MKQDPKSLTIDETSATGAVRTVLEGDRKHAEQYLRAGRAQLARMKTNYGVNARVAEGEPGGHFRTCKVMPDGTRIETITNDGLDLLRITAPQQGSSWPENPVGEGSSTGYEGEPASSEFEPEWPTGGKKEEKPPTLSFYPYLWIGVRIVKASPPPPAEGFPIRRPQKWANRLHVCVWAPKAPGEEQVILSNRNVFEPPNPRPPKKPWDTEVYPLGYWKDFIPLDFEEDPDLPLDAPLPTAVAYTKDKLVMILPENVYDIPMRIPNWDPAKDPDVEWDVIFVSDPDNDLKLADGDLNMEAGYEGGTYLVKVMSEARECAYFDPCEVEILVYVGKDQDEITAKHSFKIEQHTTYRMGMMPHGFFKPNDHANESQHSCVQCSHIAHDHGANPHGKHWWQGMATVIVPHLQVDVPVEEYVPPLIAYSDEGEVEIPDTGFEPAEFYPRIERCPACHWTSVRYYSISLGVRNMATYTEDNHACDDPFDEHPFFYPREVRTYMITQRQGEVGGTLQLPVMEQESPGAIAWHFYSHGITSYQWESEGGHSGSGGVEYYVGQMPDPVVPIAEYRWLAFYETGAYCLGGFFSSGPPTTDYDWYSDHRAGWYAHVDAILGGVPHDDEVHMCYKITKEIDGEGNVLRDELTFVSLAEYTSAPRSDMPEYGNVIGSDRCAKVERIAPPLTSPGNDLP